MNVVILALIFFVSFSARSQELSLTLIKNNLETTKARTVDQFLSELPKDALQHYTLVHTSRSLQQGSFDFPRAVIFSSNAKFIMSFNGSDEQRGYKSLELMEYNEIKKIYDFFTIEFSESLQNELKPQLSSPNPNKCLNCHGHSKTEITRALWDPGPEWKSAFNANHSTSYITSKNRYRWLPEFKPENNLKLTKALGSNHIESLRLHLEKNPLFDKVKPSLRVKFGTVPSTELERKEALELLRLENLDLSYSQTLNEILIRSGLPTFFLSPSLNVPINEFSDYPHHGNQIEEIIF